MQRVYLGSLDQSQFAGKKMLVRVDYNVTLSQKENGKYEVMSDARIRDSFETLHYLLDAGAKCIVCSHLGRPDGGFEERFSLKSVKERLQHLLPDTTVHFVQESVGPEVDKAKGSLKSGEILLLENVRFHYEEEANNREYAQQLAQGIDIYVNEAFAASHRAHASTFGIHEFIEERYAGFAMHKELNFLHNAVTSPARPAAAVIGGLKVSSKIDILINLMANVDKILIGGAMVYTFYKALGHNVGDCYVEEKALPTAENIIKAAADRDVVLRFATDLTVIPTRAFKLKLAQRGKALEESIIAHDIEYCPRNVSYTEIPNHWTGADIGPQSIRDFSLELEECQTIIYNGPMGIIEDPDFCHGTVELLKVVERRTRRGAISIVCGGETVTTIEQHGLRDFTHVSMGGGAALELLGNRELPGVSILNEETSTV